MTRRMNTRRGSAPLAGMDTQNAYEAGEIGRSHRGWVVTWSQWHRTFAAFVCLSPHLLVVDEPAHEEHPFQLFEWLIEGTEGSGACVTCHGAMDALSHALLGAGYGYGVVRPIELFRVGSFGWRFLPCNPLYRAECEGGIIRWW